MLSPKDIRINIFSFRICSFLNLLPLNLLTEKIRHESNGFRIQKQKSKWRKSMYYFWLLNSTVYTVFLVVRLAQTVMDPKNMVLHHLPLHIICTTGGSLISVWNIKIFLRSGSLNISMFNELMNQLQDMETESYKKHKNGDERQGKRYSLQERLTQLLPIMFFESGFLYCGVYAFDPLSKQFLYSILPQQYQNYGTLFGMILFEYFIFLFWVSTYNYGLFVQLLFFQNFESDLKQQFGLLRSPPFGNTLNFLSKLCDKCRQLQLRVIQFNQLFSDLIFTFKLVNLSIAITGWFFFIRVVETKPFISTVTLSLGIYSTLFHTIVYDKAFSIPGHIQELKSCISLAIVKLGYKTYKTATEIQRHEIVVPKHAAGMNVNLGLEEKLKSVPNVAIRVGGYYILERYSTLGFLNFVFANVCSLLITFK